MRGLKGRAAIVTGAGSARGIGFASARRLAEEGVRVLLTDITPGRAAELARELEAEGYAAVGVDQDITDEAGWDAVIQEVLTRWGELNILVNNAGVAILCRATDMSADAFRSQLEVNVTGTFLGCRAAMRQMQRQNAGGAIVNISSVAAFITGPGSNAYAASKAAVHMMTKTFALEGAADGVRVNSVHPGVTDTEMIAKAIEVNPESTAAILAGIPIGKFAAASEIAAAVAFLASSDASYCAGTSIVVDGGVLLQ
ncbi:NAD(P)-dependent dehydrogenase, short-chain alcohol dehydrogenase family [Sphingopyxis sp. YR583]|uniref:SDR family NAD(P)-dependent oxidoreductase n=1 Tax=Sphingopyxis sp. YR583 TaxID=1881047 RepID=UPI0008A7C28E|nr:SDR family NAD(P)-dependent oxidoreductase [Sphingopyxis sp. YR583]SEH19152.1 NAD(P)-dependent dehydrogenase, short-chain alcohol dehydrogenase family [Sphingopyxis sp. YR583]